MHSPNEGSSKNVDFLCCMLVCSRGAFNEFRAKLSQSKLRSKLKEKLTKQKNKGEKLSYGYYRITAKAYKSGEW